MTKKDFELIARVLRASHGQELPSGNTSDAETIRDIADTFAHELARVNPRFDKQRFMAACEPVEG